MITAIEVVHPVIGTLTPDDMWDEFGHFFLQDIRGLARVTGERIDFVLLYVHPAKRGAGAWRGLLAACQAAYRVIVVWEVKNSRLDAMLAREGFTITIGSVDGSPRSIGRIWRRPA